MLFSSTKRLNICKRLWAMFFARDMVENVGKNIIKNVSSKYSQNFLDHAKQSATDALKITSKRAIQKTAELTGD